MGLTLQEQQQRTDTTDGCDTVQYGGTGGTGGQEGRVVPEGGGRGGAHMLCFTGAEPKNLPHCADQVHLVLLLSPGRSNSC